MKVEAIAGVILGCASAVSADVFSSTESFTIPATGTAGPASPYPATINVSGMGSVTNEVRVRVSAFFHDHPDDVDMLLVSPGGVGVLLMSDVGGSTPATDLLFFFEDGAPPMPDSGPLAAGTYGPTDFEPGDTFPAPAPAGYSTSLTAFNGADPNGPWRLFMVDDQMNSVGRIANGWALRIDSIPAPGACALAALIGCSAAARRRR